MSSGQSVSETVVRGTVRRAAGRMKAAEVCAGMFWWLVAALGVWLALFLLDNFLNLPAGLRLPLAVGGLALVAVGFVRRVCLPAAHRVKLEHAAVALERRYGIGENLLINAFQFESRELRPEERGFAQQAIEQSGGAVARLNLAELWELSRLWKWIAGALALGVLWVGYAAWFPRYAGNAFSRYAMPLGDVPPVGSLTVWVMPAGEVTLSEGDSLEVRAEIEGGKKDDVPTIVWQERVEGVETVKSAGENAVMIREAGEARRFRYAFSDVRRSFAFRVFAGDTYSRSVRVVVLPLPRIKEAVFRLTPPGYTGLKAETLPGPPASVAGLAGSRLEIDVVTDREASGLVWREASATNAFRKSGGHWIATTTIAASGGYQVGGADAATGKPVALAAGEMALKADNPPEIDFVTEDRNRFVSPGAAVSLELMAKDDFGLKEIVVTARPAEQEQAAREVKRWTFMGPPGTAGPVKEKVSVVMNPSEFAPGATYLIEAQAWDWNPSGKPGKGRPVLLRVKSAAELSVTGDEALATAFALLQKTALEQEKANNLTANLSANLEEAQQKKTLPGHEFRMERQQEAAQTSGKNALDAFRKIAEGKSLAAKLSPLVEGEMAWVLNDIGKLETTKAAAQAALLGGVAKRQAYILSELIALLGRMSDASKDKAKPATMAKDRETPPPLTAKEAAKDLKEDLKRFINAQEKILDRSKALLDKGPEDLTEEEKQILGELAREEAKWAKFFEEKLTDYSKLPMQDFADGSLAKEVNEVSQEIKLAAKELYEKKVELAVPAEQAGLENAKKLEHNLEKWLPDTPDNQKWSMEEPPAPADVAIAELPKELEDIVGALLDKEEEMGKDVEDLSSSWMDSMDKGAGWDAMDGPISNMSAKGVTGNRLPNEMEIGGRAGEGRTGRSQGQFVEETADGKGGRETPTRLSPTPFEQGSVKDSSKDNKGGATGGGKLSGHGEEGLRGPTAPPMSQKMPRLADQQGKIRQQAEVIATKLRAYHLPTGDLETAIASMKNVEEAARKMDGAKLRQSFNHAVDALSDARQSLKEETGLRREQTKLPSWMRDEISAGLQDGLPKGYEEMAAEYFRALAEKQK